MNNIQSVIFYLFIISLSSLVAHFSQINMKCNKKDKNYRLIFIIISYMILTLPIAFRSYTGADYNSYVDIYKNIEMNGIQANNILHIEFGYILFNYICFKIFHSYLSIFIITAALTNLLFYKAILYEVKFLNLGLAIFTYGFTLYFFEYSIIRNMFGISIAAYSLKYIFEKKMIKYYIMITIAVLFHYSLIIFYVLGIIYIEKFKKYRLRFGLLVICLMPFISSIINLFVKIAILLTPRYGQYLKLINITSPRYGWSLIVYILPIIPFSMLYKKMLKISDHISLYFSFYLVSLVILIISYSNPLLIRFVYTMWISEIILFPVFFKSLNNIKFNINRKVIKGFCFCCLFIYGLIIIVNILHTKLYYMLPYKTILN